MALSLKSGLKDLVTGDWMAGDERKKAEAELAALKAMYDDVQTPDLQNLSYEDYQLAGELTPEELAQMSPVDYAAIQSEMGNISSDPRLKDQQMASLTALKELAEGGGMNAADKANLMRVQNEVAQADRGRREAILQNMQRRGMGGSGAELLAQLSSSQAATDRQSQQGLDIAGMAQQRALEAMMQSGSLAGNIRGQDFDEASRVAAAKDAIAQFNAGNTLKTQMYNQDQEAARQQFNANMRYGTAKDNLGAKQSVLNANTGLHNDATKYNTVNLPQQKFANTMDLKNAKAGGTKASYDYWQGRGAQAANAGQKLVSAGIQAGATMASGSPAGGTATKLGSSSVLAGQDDDALDEYGRTV